MPLAQAAHSACTRTSGPQPNTAAPPGRGWRSAWERAATTGWRLMAATATAALSITRLTIISATAGSTGTGSTATVATFHASWSPRARRSASG